MTRHLPAIVLLSLLSACAGETPKDYEAAARCSEMGHQSGTAAHDQCMRDERADRMMKDQRREYEQMKQNERDWKLRRY